ncbi:MAG: AAA family ATPase [Chloroflexota bacterium]
MNVPTQVEQINWDAWLHTFPDLRALAKCPQDPIFHAEGDVWTHTKMVVEAFMDGKTWQQADADTREILWWAALFHDIAKPYCTVEEGGRIRSPRHALKGAGHVGRLLYTHLPAGIMPLSLAKREQIVSLVRYHGLPLWFWDKSDMLRSVIRASLHVPPYLIAALAEADVRGRICDDQQELLDRVTLFREFCAENDCLHTAYDFPSAHSKYLYFQQSENHPTYHAYDDTMCEVTLMSGIPGAGKDTWLANNKSNMPVISLDAIRETLGVAPTDKQSPVIMRAKEQARDYLRAQQDFVWNATNLTRRMRTPLIDLFRAYNARVTIVYVEAPWDAILERNRTRDDAVPDNVLYNIAEMLEVPAQTEAQTVIWLA